ncbi:hypothetical protein HQ587_03820 [bacterium]|nr:hypothetical protein [bacterium]
MYYRTFISIGLLAVSLFTPTSNLHSTVKKRVPSGTRVLIKINQNVSSKHMKTGESVSAIVASDVLVDGAIVIAAGSRCIATVTKHKKSWYVGQPGQIQINVQMVQAFDRTFIQLTGAIASSKGRSKQTESVIIGYILCFFFYLMTGDEGYIPMGTIVEGYTAGTVFIEASE